MGKHLRLARLIELMTVIKYHPDWGPKKLADYFEISEKRIYDDLNELNAANIPIVYNGKGYTYLSEAALPPVKLNIDEVLALWMHVKLMKKHKEDVYTQAVKSAAVKLLDMLPPETGGKLLDLEGKVTVEAPRSDSRIEGVLSALNEAIVDRTTMKITYFTYSRDEVSQRLVDPYSVIFRGNSWYAICYCHTRNDIRTFRLNRISEIEATGDSFDYPEDFSIGEYVENSWAVFQGKETEVVIRFSKKLAPLIEEHRWRPDQEIVKHKNGTITFRTKVRGTLEIRRWVMSWGRGARVIEPESLRKEIASHSKALLDAHSG